MLMVPTFLIRAAVVPERSLSLFQIEFSLRSIVQDLFGMVAGTKMVAGLSTVLSLMWSYDWSFQLFVNCVEFDVKNSRKLITISSKYIAIALCNQKNPNQKKKEF